MTKHLIQRLAVPLRRGRLLLLLLALLGSLHSFAQLYSGDFYYKVLDENTCEVIGLVSGYRPSGDLIIPEKILSYKVVSIGSGAFSSRKGFTGTLTIPEGVTKIGNRAFKGCNGFTGSLIIPNSVSYIGESAFEECSGFTGELKISENTTDIGLYAFQNCSGFTGDLIIPDKVTSIGQWTFSGCEGFNGTLKIGKSVKSIGQYAFQGCYGFVGSITMPDGLTSIGEKAFVNCRGFDGELILPNTLESIETGAFSGCTHLTGALIIPEGVTTIGERAFQSCENFDGKLSLPNSLTNIGERAFWGCSGFTGDLIIPDKITSISNYLFWGCKGFNGYLSIPGNVTEIGEYAFYNCSSLRGELKIPAGVTAIGNDSFLNCSGLTGELKLPNSLTMIGNSAFYGCSGFSGELAIPESVNTIGTLAFYDCSGFTGSLIIPESISTIDNKTFSNCSGFTGALVLPSSMKSLGTTPFENCNFSEIYSFNPIPPTRTKGNIFTQDNFKSELFVPKSSLESYQTSSDWSGFSQLTSFVIGISLDKKICYLKEGNTVTLTATFSPEYAPDQNISWTSSNEDIATVDQNGVVTSVSPGKAIITATIIENGESAECEIYIPSLTITGETHAVNLNGTMQLIATLFPEDIPDRSLSWVSSNPDVATVDENGIVTGVTIGNTIITVISETGVSAEYEIFVTSLSVTGETNIILPDATLQLSATLMPDNLPDATLTWTSSNEEVATVDAEGKVTAVAPGKVTITVTSASGVSAEYVLYVTTLSVNSETNYIEPDGSLQLAANLQPDELPDRTLTWTSSNPEVATVDENGKVTAVAPGKAVITVQAVGDVTAEYEIYVTSLSVTGETNIILPDTTLQLSATLLPDDLPDATLTWTSSNEEVATVDAEGKVTAVAPGKAVITITSASGVSAEYVLYVTTLSVTAETNYIEPDGSLQLTATLLPEELPNRTLTWTSSNPEVATVDEIGKVTAVAPGKTVITVQAVGDVTAEYDIYVTSLSVTGETNIILPDATLQLSATLLPDDLPDATLTWTSSNEEVATVDADGKVTAVAPGKATITVTSASGVSAQYGVFVPELTLTSNSNVVKAGETLALTAKLLPEDLPNSSLTWKSSDVTVATVSEQGIVTGVKDGSCEITVANAYGQEASYKVIVSTYSAISLSVSSAVLKSGEALRITGNDDFEHTTVTWTSSNPNVATVDQEGNVQAVSTGSAIISATLTNGISASATVYVADLTLVAQKRIKVGESSTIVPIIRPLDYDNYSLVWSSSDESRATVDEDGKVTVTGFGPVEITASLVENPEVKASCEIQTEETVGQLTYYYDGKSNGVVISKISDAECYIVPRTLAVTDASGEQTVYTVKKLELGISSSQLKKVAYPQGAAVDMPAGKISIAYNGNCTIADGVITNPVTGQLVFVDMSIGGTYSISKDIQSVEANAFALCTGITDLRIEDSKDILSFRESTAFLGIGLKSVYLGRNLSYTGSPFQAKSTITEVTIGSQVTTIAKQMFEGCTALRYLTIPVNVTTIEDQAFAKCSGLSQLIIEETSQELAVTRPFADSPIDYLYYARPVNGTHTWPTSLKSVETGRFPDKLPENEFTGLPNLYSLTIGVGVKDIPESTFSKSKITKVIWLPNTPPTGFESIDAEINYVSTEKYEFKKQNILPSLSSKFAVDGLVYVFNKQAANKTVAVIDNRYDRYKTALDVPAHTQYQGIEMTVEEVNDYAIYRNQYYTSARIADGVLSIGKYAMYRCDGIVSKPYIGNTVKTIGDYALYGCTGIPSVVIPDATQNLGAWSLASCTSLSSALLGEGLLEIKEGCFSGDGSLKQLIVPANVKTIGNKVFDRCTSLSYFEISDRSSEISLGYSEHNPDYKESQGTIGGLTTAGKPLFYYCPLKEVYIGGGISYSTSPADGYSPFYRNDNIEKVTIHNHETDISDNEFYGCRGLKEVVVGNDVLRIGDYSFSGCLSLEYFSLGSKVETIGTDAFSDCDKMIELKSYNRVPPVCADQAMDDINKFTCTLYVPENAVDAYKVAPQWENFFHIEGMEAADVPAESIKLSTSSLDLTVGDTQQIEATVTPTDTTDPVVWESSDESVARVSQAGFVTAIAEGTATITVTCGDVKASCTVNVQPTTGIEDVTDGVDVNVSVLNGSILVEAPEGAEVEVYSMSGALVAHTRDHRIDYLTRGVYLVRVCGRVFKIAL